MDEPRNTHRSLEEEFEPTPEDIAEANKLVEEFDEEMRHRAEENERQLHRFDMLISRGYYLIPGLVMSVFGLYLTVRAWLEDSFFGLMVSVWLVVSGLAITRFALFSDDETIEKAIERR